ncbi:MAG TPA: DMT family transporter [Mesorhizobium sp.]|jgi:drug/metabolite transporter (DMT)-like permease|nr:DMT family transporter [Mesorhizobium sp.]
MTDRAQFSGDRATGVLLVLASAAFFSLAGILTKSIAVDAWTIAGWRGFVGGLLVAAYVALQQRQSGGPLLPALGRKGWLVAAVSASASILFITSFKFTSVAHAVVIYATVPFMAAAVAFLAVGDKPGVRTLLAAAIAFVGVVMTVASGSGDGHISGDLMAVGMAFGSACYLVMVRRFRDTPTVWASGVAAFMLVVPSLLMGDFTAASPQDWLLMTLFGASFAAAVITWTEGAKRVAPEEAGFLGVAEVPVAIFLAWSLLAEQPTAATLLGGAIVLGAVLVHTIGEAKRPAAEKG